MCDNSRFISITRRTFISSTVVLHGLGIWYIAFPLRYYKTITPATYILKMWYQGSHQTFILWFYCLLIGIWEHEHICKCVWFGCISKQQSTMTPSNDTYLYSFIKPWRSHNECCDLHKGLAWPQGHMIDGWVPWGWPQLALLVLTSCMSGSKWRY